MVTVFDLNELARHVYTVNNSYWHTGKRVWLFRNENIGLDNLVERRLYLVDVGFDSIVVFVENGVYYSIDIDEYVSVNHSVAKCLMDTTDMSMKEIFEFGLL